MSSQELPFQLLMWIKREQEEIRAHKEKMAKKNYEDDKQYMGFMSEILKSWSKLKFKERQLILSFVDWHNAHKNFSPNQRSAIASMYIKYNLAPKE